MRNIITFILVVIAADSAAASPCSIRDWLPAETITDVKLNARHAQIEACINGRIGNANLNPSEPIAVSNLANQKAVYAISWTLSDDDGDATAGENICGTGADGATSCTDLFRHRVPVNSTIIGMSVALRCPSDNTGTPRDCAAASVNISLQEDANTVKTFSAVATNVAQVDFALGTDITSADVLNVDVTGTFTDVDFLDIVIYLKAQHQS